MYNQGPTIGRINPSFNDPQNEQDPSQKSRMGQPMPPPYQEYPSAGYHGSGFYPNTSGYPSQPYGPPGGPQGPYAHQPYPGMSAYPQGPYAGPTGVTVQPTAFMTSTPSAVQIPDYLCYSIFTLLCCCFPLGIAAVVYSASTRDNNMAGRQDLAIRSSRAALVLNNIALGFGLIVYVACIILILYMYGVIE